MKYFTLSRDIKFGFMRKMSLNFQNPIPDKSADNISRDDGENNLFLKNQTLLNASNTAR